MQRHCLSLAVLACLALAAPARAQDDKPDRPAPVFDNLGRYHCQVTTRSKLAQKYFDQGMLLLYGFNHAEAVRSFEAGAKLDPDCAMCYWGVACALGPNINAPMADDAVPKAWAALRKAVDLAPKVSARERAYIGALAERYAEKPVEDRSDLDKAYADAMREVHRQYPDDLDAATLFAEALMDTTPWNYYDEGNRPRGITNEITRALEHVLARDPNHPGANHYYIHAVEASETPERGLPCAHRLGRLYPGAGHLVHMPAHIFLRLGMYHDASLANEKAIAADEGYIAACRVQGFYPALYYSHNAHFLCYCLGMEGRGREAAEAATKTAKILHMPDADPMAYMQWLRATPVFALARFGGWDELLEVPEPNKHMLFEKAMWHYGRGLAHARRGAVDKAAQEAAALALLVKAPEFADLEQKEFPGVSVAKVALAVLDAEAHAAAGRTKERVAALQKAVELQDALPYMEPPFWYFPTRQLLGKALLEAGDVEGAEKVYREDLRKHPDNGWSLFGLLQTLRARGRTAEADGVAARFREAWQHADVTLTSSCF